MSNKNINGIENVPPGYRKCPFCHKSMRSYAICNCEAIFNYGYSSALLEMSRELKSEPYWDDEHYLQAIPVSYIDEVREKLLKRRDLSS